MTGSPFPPRFGFMVRAPDWCNEASSRMEILRRRRSYSISKPRHPEMDARIARWTWRIRLESENA